jgi:hypothetical protein
MEAKYPILIIEGQDVLAFSSLESAERYLEPWWVNEGRGRVYDARGHRLTTTCDGQRVILRIGQTGPGQEHELRAALRAHFRARGKPTLDDEKLSLPQLIATLDLNE